MTEKKKAPRLPGGPLKKIWGFSVPMQEQVLAKHPEIVAYLRRTAKALDAHFSAHGTREISAPRRILIDRLLSQLAVCRVFETYLAHGGFLRRDKADQGVLEPHGLVAAWQAQNNQVNRTLALLGLDELPTQGPTPIEAILAEYQAEDEGEPETPTAAPENAAPAEEPDQPEKAPGKCVQRIIRPAQTEAEGEPV